MLFSLIIFHKHSPLTPHSHSRTGTGEEKKSTSRYTCFSRGESLSVTDVFANEVIDSEVFLIYRPQREFLEMKCVRNNRGHSDVCPLKDSFSLVHSVLETQLITAHL